MAGLYVPPPTLRRRPHGRPRTDQGRRGLLLLHRCGLSPHTPCRFLPAHSLALQPAGSLSRHYAAFVTRLQSNQLPGQTARQLPDQSTIVRMEPASIDKTRRRGAPTRFRRTRSVPLVGQHVRVHRIPASRVVTTAIRPSVSEAGWAHYTPNQKFGKLEYF